MKDFWKKYNDISLVKRIVVGLIIGTVLALIRPGLGEGSSANALDAVKIFGSLYTGGLKGIAPILVFFLVMEALSKHKDGQQSNMKHVIILYLTATFAAALISVIASFLFPVDLTLPPAVEEITPPQGLDEVLKTLLMNLVDNPVKALIWVYYFGLCL